MGADRRNKSTFVLAGEVVGQLLADFQTRNDNQMSRIWSQWARAVGVQIAANSRPTAYKGSTLYVNVQSSVWMMELRYLRGEIIRKINDSLGNDVVKEIKLKVGPT